MNYEHLLEKLASTQLNVSPAVADLMQRIRETGLHKVAAHMHNVPEFTFKTATQILGTQLIHQHLKFSKIASGIRALQALDQSGEITLEKTAGPPPIPAAALKGLRSAGAEAGGAARGAARAAAKPPPIPAAAKKAPSAETTSALQEIMPPGMGPSEAGSALTEMRQMSPPPPKPGGGGGLFDAPAGPSPFSGNAPGPSPGFPTTPSRIPEGGVDPNLQTIMNNLGTSERAAFGKAFGVAPDAITPAMYMRGAHGVPMPKAASLNLAKMAQVFYANA